MFNRDLHERKNPGTRSDARPLNTMPEIVAKPPQAHSAEPPNRDAKAADGQSQPQPLRRPPGASSSLVHA